MGHTNSTANLSLPQFIGTDKPTWLGDVNGAFGAIDTAVGTINADILAVDAKADNAVADASSAVTVANNASTTAGNANTTATTANNIANNALTVANNADGHTNQLELKVGLLADLTTTDKSSIVNAINEVNGAIGTPSASQVSYDNTGSGLTATNVQDAIDEVAQGGGGTSDVTLWTNSNPTASFAAQAVTVPDMSSYSKIIIKYIDEDADKAEEQIIIPPEAATDYSYNLSHVFEQTGDLRIATRNLVYTNATTITFADAKAWTAFNSGSTSNKYLIPTEILGRA